MFSNEYELIGYHVYEVTWNVLQWILPTFLYHNGICVLHTSEVKLKVLKYN